jgi:sarcosine oxidase
MHGGGAGDWFYGFPRMPGETSVKVAAERFDTPLESADDLDPAVSPAEADFVWRRHIEGRVKGLKPNGVRAAACLYTMAPDSRFVIGRDPDHERVIVVSACSGHGFKHSPAIGEAVAGLALDGEAPEVLAPFDPARALAAADGR